MSETSPFEKLLGKFGNPTLAAKKRIENSAREAEKKAALEKAAHEAKKEELIIAKSAQEEVSQPANSKRSESIASTTVSSGTSEASEEGETKESTALAKEESIPTEAPKRIAPSQEVLQKAREKLKKRTEQSKTKQPSMLDDAEAFLEKYSNPEDSYIDYLNLLERLGIISTKTRKLLTGITLSEVAKQLKTNISDLRAATAEGKFDEVAKNVKEFAKAYNGFKGELKALFELKKQLKQTQKNTTLQKEKKEQLKEQLGEDVVNKLTPQELVLLTNPYLSETLLSFAGKYKKDIRTSFPDKAILPILLSVAIKENKAIAAAQTVNKLVKKQQERREKIKNIKEIYSPLKAARESMRSDQRTLDTLDTLYNEEYLIRLAANKIITPEDALLLSNQSAKDLWDKTEALKKQGKQLLKRLAERDDVIDSEIQAFKGKVEELNKAIEELLEKAADVEKNFKKHKRTLEEKGENRKEQRQSLLDLPNSPWTVEKVNNLEREDLVFLSFPYFQKSAQENRENLEENKAWLEEAKELHVKVQQIQNRKVRATQAIQKLTKDEEGEFEKLMTQRKELILNPERENVKAFKKAFTASTKNMKKAFELVQELFLAEEEPQKLEQILQSLGMTTEDLEKLEALDLAKELHAAIKVLKQEVNTKREAAKLASKCIPAGQRESAQNLITQYEKLSPDLNAENTDALKQKINSLPKDSSIQVKVVAGIIKGAIEAREKLAEKEAALQQALQSLGITVQDLKDLEALEKHQTDNTTIQSQASSKSTKTTWGGIRSIFTNPFSSKRKPQPNRTGRKYSVSTEAKARLSTPLGKIIAGGLTSKSQPLLSRRNSIKGETKQPTSKSL